MGSKASTMLAASTGQKGFSLLELVAVIAILGILASMAVQAVGSALASGQEARFATDETIIQSAVAHFFSQSRPNVYPVKADQGADQPGATGVDSGVLPIDFDAHLPQDPSKTLVPDFLHKTPTSAQVVSWLINTANGAVFFIEGDVNSASP